MVTKKTNNKATATKKQTKDGIDNNAPKDAKPCNMASKQNMDSNQPLKNCICGILPIVVINIITTSIMLLVIAYWWQPINQHILANFTNFANWHHTQDYIPTAEATNNNYDYLQQQLADLQNKYNNIEQQLLDNATDSGISSTQTDIYEELQRRIDSLERNPQHNIEELNRKLEHYKNELSAQITKLKQNNGENLRPLLAFQKLQSDILSGRNYQKSLHILRQMIGNNQNIQSLLDILATQAETGLPSELELVNLFQQALQQFLQQQEDNSALTPKDDSFYTQLKQNITKFITIRRTDITQNGSPIAIVNSAEQYIKDGNYALAIAELESLPDNMKIPFQQWIEVAKSHNDIVKALNNLNMEIAAQSINNAQQISDSDIIATTHAESTAEQQPLKITQQSANTPQSPPKK